MLSILLFYLQIILLILFILPSTLSALKTLSTTTMQNYKLRLYNPLSDVLALEEICANVYGGGDYLPKVAESYVADDMCSFLALTTTEETTGEDTAQTINDDEEDNVIAVANYKRLPVQNSAWIEAVRTHPNHQGKGLATKLLNSIIEIAKEEDDIHNKAKEPINILTCTVESNKGMKRALEKVGFIQSGSILPTLKFASLKALPGWSPDCNKESQSLLDALELNHLVSPFAKAISSSSKWDIISTEKELLDRLQLCKSKGCSGYIPGLYEFIVPGKNRHDLKHSMNYGLVLALDVTSSEKEVSSCESKTGDVDDDESNVGQVILVLTKDERISSLKSQWVCSIVSYTQIGFEVALLHAHSKGIARRIHSFGCEQKDIGNDMDGRDVSASPFCLVFDDAIPKHPGTLAHALPRVDDQCVVFSYQHK